MEDWDKYNNNFLSNLKNCFLNFKNCYWNDKKKSLILSFNDISEKLREQKL